MYSDLSGYFSVSVFLFPSMYLSFSLCLWLPLIMYNFLSVLPCFCLFASLSLSLHLRETFFFFYLIFICSVVVFSAVYSSCTHDGFFYFFLLAIPFFPHPYFREIQFSPHAGGWRQKANLGFCEEANYLALDSYISSFFFCSTAGDPCAHVR